MSADTPPAAEADTSGPVPLGRWLADGLRAAFLLPPRLAATVPQAWQLLLVLALATAVDLVLGWFEVGPGARFEPRAWLATAWGTGAICLLVWLLQPRGGSATAGWLLRWLVASLPAALLAQAIAIAQSRGLDPGLVLGEAWYAWGAALLIWGWATAAGLRLAASAGMADWRLGALGAGMLLVFAVNAWYFPERPWQPEAGLAAQERPGVELTQELFEQQQALMRDSGQALAAERPGVVDVYGLVFSPYADEDVFLRESTMVAELLAERFDADGRVLHLANHALTAQKHPWATPANLRRAVQAIAARMDRERDVLVVYLTSHGASDHRLAATLQPLGVAALTPADLRQALDAAGIRNRVIAVSACYAGGWVPPLAGEGTLVMTAADADHTSYGCGKLSELTFFGRAVFDEQLRRTHSFEQAFAAAVPVIRRREVEAAKPDGFSNPQISVGAAIRPVLQALAQRLDAKP